jgi:hypothetical protein
MRPRTSRRRWAPYVFTEAGLDRRYYELCALTELKNALRSGDIWVPGSRQFRDFEDYLFPIAEFELLDVSEELPLTTGGSFDRYGPAAKPSCGTNWKKSIRSLPTTNCPMRRLPTGSSR